VRRRDVLKLAALNTMAPILRAAAPDMDGAAAAGPESGTVIDAHIHLFDPLRPGGVPWPEKTDTVLYKPALPERYAALAGPFGVVGAIAVECSPLESDNRWLLNAAAGHPMIVGVVGNLVPDAPGFAGQLDRLAQNPLFLGIRYGNLWNRDLAADLDRPGFTDGLKVLASAGLVLESANPDPRLIAAIRRVQERVPGLRIVVDHLPHASVPPEAAARDVYWADLRALARNPGVFVKLSEIPARVNGMLETDPDFYRARLDALWDVFGEDHILFGSDWPNGDRVASYAQTFAIVRDYMARKCAAARLKYFSKNSLAAYRWKQRRPGQAAA